MHSSYKRARALRQDVLRLVDGHLSNWLHGPPQRAGKVQAEIDALIEAALLEVQQDAYREARDPSNDR
jgi:hypothetical protein